ncbi:FAD-dependent oxidoreductase domain-containing protein 2-like [Watersipora subatra]|uniref:FAD-dependent oxidoreductase domain-containing protein 2-like n=1 Tax=Watersipora subatra TaxID=2589382 RepID=UPI00355C6F61
MRHDWNSLLTDDLSLRVTKYSKDFFPHKSVMIQYLNDFTRHYQLNVQYETDIRNITPSQWPGGKFTMQDQFANIYSCAVVIVATGYSKEKLATFPGSEHTVSYGDMSMNPDDYLGHSVLILGRGNSGFETADGILSSTNFIHMLSRSRVKLSWETHYVGDLRAINNGLLDTYQLKSLDGVLEAPVSALNIVKLDNGKLRVKIDEKYTFDNYAMRCDYDTIISCLGFVYDFSIFNQSAAHPTPHKRFSKFPSIHQNYESDSIAGLFFAGTSTHSLDFKRSAGGFIHGFRYTTRALFHLLEWKYQGVKWPSTSYSWLSLSNAIIKRVNEASGTYQMFGVLGDVMLIDDEEKRVILLEEFPVKLLGRLYEHSGHNHTRSIVMLFEYGKDFSGPGKDIFRTTRSTGEPYEAHTSNFLHPTFYYYKTSPTEDDLDSLTYPDILPNPDRLHHIVEDFLTDFDARKSHILPLRRYLETCLGTDLRHHFQDECFELALAHKTLPLDCEERYMANMGLGVLS